MSHARPSLFQQNQNAGNSDIALQEVQPPHQAEWRDKPDWPNKSALKDIEHCIAMLTYSKTKNKIFFGVTLIASLLLIGGLIKIFSYLLESSNDNERRLNQE